MSCDVQHIQNAFCNPAADGRLEHFFKNTLGNVKTNHDTAERIKEFVEKAFTYAGLNWNDYVVTSEDYFRPNEVNYLLGDYSKAKKILGWEPKVDIDELVKIMVDSDMELAKQEKVLFENRLLLPTWEHAVKT